MDGNEHTMDDFAGFLETDISDVDFFAAEEEETETENVKDKSKKNPASEDTSKEEEEQEEEESTEDDFFEDAEQEEEESEEEESEEEESEEEETETQSGDSITTLNLLKGKGFLDYELEEGEELTDEKASEILEDSLDNLFEERIVGMGKVKAEANVPSDLEASYHLLRLRELESGYQNFISKVIEQLNKPVEN